jgi:hypothetical protein
MESNTLNVLALNLNRIYHLNSSHGEIARSVGDRRLTFSIMHVTDLKLSDMERKEYKGAEMVEYLKWYANIYY